MSSSDTIPKSELLRMAETLSTLNFEDLVVLSKFLGFTELQVRERLRHTSRGKLTLELLLEFSDRTTCHVRRRLGQVLLNNGHWREALKIYPQGSLL